VLLVMLASLPAAILSSRSLVVVSSPNPLDDSWLLDTSFKASRGVWLGRDVAFTYGPLFQWLSSVPSRWMGLSMGSTYATWNTLPLWGTFLCGWLTLRLLLPEQPAWKRFLLLLLLSIFWSPSDLRISFAVLLFALFLRGWYAVQQHLLRPGLLGCGAALLCALAFLYSADSGIYAIAALLISLIGVAWEGRRELGSFGRYGVALLSSVAASVALVLVINAIMARPLDFGFWRNSLAIVSAYRWMEPSMMIKAGKIQLLATLLAGGVIFLLRRTIRSKSIAASSGFLLSAFLFAMVTMQAGLVRSDAGHIAIASFALIVFASAILFSFQSRAASVLGVSAAILCSILCAHPASMFYPSSIRYRYAQLRHPLTACPNDFKKFDRVCFPEELPGLLSAGSDYLQQHSGAGDSIVVFPYQTMFGIASQRNVAGGVMQSYLASGPYLSRLDIAGLERAAAPAGLYFPDIDPAHDTNWVASLAIDGVPSFTRSPEVWFWLFRHYRSGEPVAPGIVGLLRDDARAAQISMQSQPLAIVPKTFPIRKRSSTLDLGAPAWPSGDADFLRLRLTVRYSFWWKLRKPERLQLEITRADGSRDLRSFIVEPNTESEVWFYPWSEPDLARYFDADETHWRAGPRPAITNLRLWTTPLDWVSVQPDAVIVQAVDAVKFSLP
jgi:hypothetical protein